MSNKHGRLDARTPGSDRYTGCIITPMTENGDGNPEFKLVHLVDALIVGGIAFFTMLIGAELPAIVLGQESYVTMQEVMSRAVTASIAFALTFLAQWARYRGIQIRSVLTGGE